MGVKINDVRIQNITVPAAVSAAYEDVNNAKNEKTKRLDEAEKVRQRGTAHGALHSLPDPAGGRGLQGRNHRRG